MLIYDLVELEMVPKLGNRKTKDVHFNSHYRLGISCSSPFCPDYPFLSTESQEFSQKFSVGGWLS